MAAAFLTTGAVPAVVGVLAGMLPWCAPVALWAGLSLVLAGAAYAGLGSGVFGKRRDGRMAWWAIATMLPFLAAAWGAWYVRRVLMGGRCCHPVAPGLWLGRRPVSASEVPAPVRTIVDMAAEFPERRDVIAGREYLSLPTLDNHPPPLAALRSLVDRLAGAEGDVYIHCAAGLGRSAIVAAAVMVRRGLARDAADAVAKLSAVRAGVRLNRRQFRLLHQVLGESDR